jgi:hypothetical protein
MPTGTTGFRRNLGRTVAANIVEAVEGAAGITNGHYPLTKHVEGEVVAGVRHVVDVPHDLPGLTKNLPALQFEELGVAVDPSRKT